MNKINVCLVLFSTFIVITGCQSNSQTKSKQKKEKPLYEKGNLYGEFGKQMGTADILDSMIRSDLTGITSVVMNFKWITPKPYYIFTEKEGEGDGFYTGAKEAGGATYTWSAQIEYVSSLKEMCEKIGWQRPVYINYENKTIPLTAYIDENGQLVSAVGKNVDNPIYVGINTIQDSDIWYCYGMGNDIKNRYYRLSAYSVAIGECAFAQATSNSMLLKDIARLTGAKAGLSEIDTDVELSDEDIKQIATKVDQLDDAIKEKIKINKKLTNAISGAIFAAIKEGVDLSAQIALDVADVAAHALDPAWVANYIIAAYGPTKDMQNIGKLADKQSQANYKYGSARLKLAQDILKRQKTQLNAIMSED